MKKTRKKPSWFDPDDLVGFNGPYSGNDISFYTTTLRRDGQHLETYHYWIEKIYGVHINSGWHGDYDDHKNPAFLWRPTNSSASFSGYNARNPYVLPQLVQEIHERSIQMPVESIEFPVDDPILGID